MDFTTICRTCLGAECLNPIFKKEEDYNRYSIAMYIVTGLKVEFNDGLPQHMCKDCMQLLNDSLKFRKQCKDVEAQLLNIKNSRDSRENDIKYIEVSHTIPGKRKKSKDCSDTALNKKTKDESSEHENKIPLQNTSQNITDKKINKNVKNESLETNSYETEEFVKTDNIDIEDTIQDFVDMTDNFNYEELMKPCSKNESIDKYYIGNLDGIDSNHSKEVITSQNRVKILNDVSDIENTLFIKQESNRVTCKLCQKELSIRSMDSHMLKKHPGADTRKVKCELCEKYVLKERLNHHKTVMHGQNCFRCGYCKTEFNSREVLVDHVTSCAAKNKKRNPANKDKRSSAMIECDVCQKVMQKASLRMHKEIKHAGMGPVCEHCGRRFGNRFRLQEHLRAKHGHDKLQCSLCPFRSASSMAIRNHERRHRGEKPFVCEACGAEFHAPHLLAQHRQSHRTRKDMKCDQCPASFKANNTLHMHKITCHNTHTYQCSMCPRTYSCRHYAVKHLRNVHRYTGPVGTLHKTSALAPGIETGADKPSVVAAVRRVE